MANKGGFPVHTLTMQLVATVTFIGFFASSGVQGGTEQAPAASTASGAPAREGQRPNIVFILVDDLGPEWLSCYGSEHKTPNLDRLAETGIRFQTVYSSPMCTPTLHELLT